MFVVPSPAAKPPMTKRVMHKINRQWVSTVRSSEHHKRWENGMKVFLAFISSVVKNFPLLESCPCGLQAEQ
jgi:hypothetical protein